METRKQNFFRVTEEITIQIPALPRPSLADLQELADFQKHRRIKFIESDNSPTELTTLVMGTVLRSNYIWSPKKETDFAAGTILRSDEYWITGKEYKKRIASVAALGYQHAAWLVKHQDELPEFRAFLTRMGGYTWKTGAIDFPGLVVMDQSGFDQIYPCLIQDQGRCCLRWGCFGDGFDLDMCVAVSK